MISENAQIILNKRFLAPFETWEGLCKRVADKIAEAENPENRKYWSIQFYNLIFNLDFLPNSPTLRNFGRNKGSGSACFVLPVEDSRRGIFKTLSDAVDIQAYGGGTGFSFSRIRPKGDEIKSTQGQASGPISFIRIYDFTIGDIIKQGGVRHGANMAVLRIDHPDILEFITAKSKEGVLKNFNISVGITDEFMKGVKEDNSFNLIFNNKVYKSTSARMIWNEIIDCAWNNGEPGILFLDTINKHNPLRMLGQIESTNPCGEQPLLPYSSCNLGSINLSQMVKGDWIKDIAEIDWEKLSNTVRVGTRLLDNVIMVNNYPIPEIEDITKKTRQIGLGIMGFADLCIKMHIHYGSPESIVLAEKVMKFIYDKTHEVSVLLSEEKGPAPFFNEYPELCKRRNGTLTTIAPTGTLSMIADCSSGCEPHFAFDYTKECLDGQKLPVLPKVVNEWVKNHGHRFEPLPDYFVTARDVSVEEHILVQAAFQNNGVDSGVSKTINARYETSKQEVSDAFFLAWSKGCKGITFFRDGSRKHQALCTSDEKELSKNHVLLKRGELKPRPRATTGPSIKIQTACGKLYVDPHFDSEDLQEVFIRTEGGGCEANTKAIGVLASYCLRAGVSKKKLIKSMKNIHCPACTRAISSGKDVEVRSCAAGMGKALEFVLTKREIHCQAAKMLEDINQIFKADNLTSNGNEPEKKGECPDCFGKIYHADGCARCANPECGWSRC